MFDVWCRDRKFLKIFDRVFLKFENKLEMFTLYSRKILESFGSFWIKFQKPKLLKSSKFFEIYFCFPYDLRNICRGIGVLDEVGVEWRYRDSTPPPTNCRLYEQWCAYRAIQLSSKAWEAYSSLLTFQDLYIQAYSIWFSN